MCVVVEDGEETLNVELVRAGAYPAGVMADRLGFAQRYDPERREMPRRIMPEERYRAYLKRVAAAEQGTGAAYGRTSMAPCASRELTAQRPQAPRYG
jgi:hypothetical protein